MKTKLIVLFLLLTTLSAYSTEKEEYCFNGQSAIVMFQYVEKNTVKHTLGVGAIKEDVHAITIDIIANPNIGMVYNIISIDTTAYYNSELPVIKFTVKDVVTNRNLSMIKCGSNYLFHLDNGQMIVQTSPDVIPQSYDDQIKELQRRDIALLIFAVVITIIITIFFIIAIRIIARFGNK